MKVGVAILVVVSGLIGSNARAGDWGEWRGPTRDGISKETGLLKSWPEGGPRLLWRVDHVGGGYSTPSAVGDRLYIIGNEGMDTESVRALNVLDGSVVWSTRIGKVGLPDQNPNYPGSRSTPTVDGERIYAFSSDGDLACIERASGKILWNRNVQSAFGGQPGRWAYAESPLVDGDNVVVAPGGPEAPFVALNKKTGETVWVSGMRTGEEAAYASAVVTHASGVKQYVHFLQGGVAGVEAATGNVLWRYGRVAKGSPANIPTSIVQGDYVYSATKRGGAALLKIDLDRKGAFEEVYYGQKLPTHLGGSVLVNGHLYGTTSSALLCTVFETGGLKWTDRSVGAASIVYADGRLYLAGEDGEVALVEATPTEYRELGRFTPVDPPDRGKSKVWAYPVVANGRLYIRDLNVLWCYDVGERASSE